MAHHVSNDNAILIMLTVLVPEKIEIIAPDLVTAQGPSVNVDTVNLWLFLRQKSFLDTCSQSQRFFLRRQICNKGHLADDFTFIVS